MAPKQFKKSFAAQGKFEQERRERSIRERESHVKAKTYLEHLAVDYIMKTVVFENSEQLPPLEEMKEILQLALKSSLSRQQSELSTASNTIYTEIEKYLDEYTEFLIQVLQREIQKSKQQKVEPMIVFDVKSVKPLSKKESSNFSEAMSKNFSLIDLVTK